ncbi:cupin domain-containing protein [Erwinia psidii]|uniref:Cupin domain-containing protein n=1 Tax=Erwinia psidii TaxID=69224 RepID=A0A3N6SI02_9GAMM|nr:hypothetical protein [Erwinia psidii]MCX8957775.1 hypothetical protein [Erwinia psidii]MCX8960824.1 hypothetical protein [Erwinia psidii]MCX8964936.1 hypothetical protein [Erwinia psidii]RQM38391.1 hypothetical protein EB241_09155 [Erwinia psidii]
MKTLIPFFLASASLFISITGHAEPIKTIAVQHRIPAVKLINTADNHSAFIKGSVPSLAKLSSEGLYFSNTFEEWQKGIHPAPKKQYVVTLVGKLKFKVSDGSTFIIEPGTVLLAADTMGEGHSWDIIDGKEWTRVYIPVGDNDHFIADQ